MKTVDKVLLINDPDSDMFSLWVEYLYPKHHLTRTEQKVFSAFLRFRYELSRVISDPKILDEVCLNESNRDRIRIEMDMSKPQFNGILTQIKDAKLIKPVSKPFTDRVDYYIISPTYIPPYDGSGEFKLMLILKDIPDAIKYNKTTDSEEVSDENV